MRATGDQKDALTGDDTIVWQGQPEASILWADMFRPIGVVGLVLAGGAILGIWATASATGGMRVTGLLIGPPALLAGLYLLVGRLMLNAYLRSKTHYTLTERAALITTEAFGRKRQDVYPLRDMDGLRLEDGIPGCIIFSEDSATGASSGATKVGFRRVAYARELFGQMRQLREAQRTRGIATQ